MNSSNIIRAPTFASDGKVKMIVLKMTLKNLAFAISLNILPILKALAKVAYRGPSPCSLTNPIIRVRYDMTTIVKSKMFHPLLK